MLSIEGMTCEHCERAVGGAIGELAGVHRVSVDAVAGTAVVEHESPLDEQELRMAVDEAGYVLLP